MGSTVWWSDTGHKHLEGGLKQIIEVSVSVSVLVYYRLFAKTKSSWWKVGAGTLECLG